MWFRGNHGTADKTGTDRPRMSGGKGREEEEEKEGQRAQGGMNVEDEGAGYVNKLLELVEQSRGKVPPSAWEGIKGCCHEITGNQQK